MELALDIVKGKKLYINSYKFSQKNGFVGRSKDAEFQLEDENSYISSKHVLIEYKDSFYFITDISTNGTYLKNPYRKLPKDTPIKINNSDIYIIGDYELKARLLDNEVNSFGLDGYVNLLGSKAITNQMIIPDDDFLLVDSNIMKNSFLKEDKLEPTITNFLDIYEKNDNSVLNILQDTNTIEEVETQYEIETISSLNEHIEEKFFNINTFDEGVECELEEEIENLPVLVSNTPSIKILEKTLGINISSLKNEEQEKVLEEIANIVLSSIDGLKTSLLLKDKTLENLSIKNSNDISKDLNPIRRGKNEALESLMNSSNEVITLSQAIKKSFLELDNHNLSIEKTNKNLITKIKSEFEPSKLESNFDKEYKYRAFIPKKFQLWDAFISSYKHMIKEDSDLNLNIKEELSKEYLNQIENSNTII